MKRPERVVAVVEDIRRAPQQEKVSAKLTDEEWRLSKSVVGGTTNTYGYDSHGLRDYKIVNGTAIYYRYASGKLLQEYNAARTKATLGKHISSQNENTASEVLAASEAVPF